MKFKVKFGTFFVLKIVLIVTFLWLAYNSFNEPLSYDWFGQYNYLLYIAAALSALSQCYRLIYSTLSGKPVLIVNEAFIYDFDGDVKYYWRDIDTINERDSYLYISLHHPAEYLDRIGNPVKKLRVKLWFRPEGRRSSFLINIDNVAEDPTALLRILNNYSIGIEN